MQAIEIAVTWMGQGEIVAAAGRHYRRCSAMVSAWFELIDWNACPLGG